MRHDVAGAGAADAPPGPVEAWAGDRPPTPVSAPGVGAAAFAAVDASGDGGHNHPEPAGGLQEPEPQGRALGPAVVSAQFSVQAGVGIDGVADVFGGGFGYSLESCMQLCSEDTNCSSFVFGAWNGEAGYCETWSKTVDDGGTAPAPMLNTYYRDTPADSGGELTRTMGRFESLPSPNCPPNRNLL
jgi:hypothetical protein